MTVSDNRFTLARTVIGAGVLLLAACSTPPQTPYTPPPPRQPPPMQRPPTEASEQQQQPPGAPATAQQPQAPAEAQPAPPEPAPAAAPSEPPPQTAQPTAPPPRPDSPDVEITDIPLDEHGNPIVQERTSPAAASSGAPMPPGGEPRERSAGARGTASTGAPMPAINVGTAATSAEQSAALERDLAEKLAKFDELMRKAREDAEKERAAGGGEVLGGGELAGVEDGAGGRRLPPPRSGAGGQADQSSGLGNTPDYTGSTRPGDYRQATGVVPEDAPSGRDDDIVARQLREAATRETDPVLREKLWEEYRKYKIRTSDADEANRHSSSFTCCAPRASCSPDATRKPFEPHPCRRRTSHRSRSPNISCSTSGSIFSIRGSSTSTKRNRRPHRAFGGRKGCTSRTT